MNRTLADLNRVVAIGGGHGLGRVMSSLSFLGSRLTGVVTTTDNGGSTGRIRRSEGGIAWGDMRNCLNQLITQPSIASAMFEYRFSGQGELAGHNLGNLMLTALDSLSVRPLEAMNLIRNVLKVDALLIPMSEQAVDLVATSASGQQIYGETAIDALVECPSSLTLMPQVKATLEAVEAINDADVVLLGPGSFYTSIMPVLLVAEIAQALRYTPAKMLFIDNLGVEHSSAGQLQVQQKIAFIETTLERRVIDGLILGEQSDISGLQQRLVIQRPLDAADVSYRHDRQRLRSALDDALQALS